ncbi:Sap, sulfolipid-1-addressing protein [Mycobacterium sp. 88mf]|nr:GAP family protein [Mycolicibacterium septicum]SEQ42652.1 Sap, sulfolipid-1-addressing protein [Mycobacterium sp. 88mf]SFF48647.1 Sap, sulfolipid-1-addressing protein [Mycobacterium sp. 455mf]
MSRAVWGSLFGMAIVMAFNPALLALILLVISRPRPVQNLLVCWIGCLTTNIPALVIPVMLLHRAPMFSPQAPAANAATRHIQLGMGVLVLSVAALIAVRFWVRRRAQVPAPSGNAPGQLLESEKPAPISSPFAGMEEATEGKSAIRRLFGRLQRAWDSGALWVALVCGMGFLPGFPLVLFVTTTVVSSGASTGTQIIAVILFVVAMFAVFEVAVVSHLIAPVRTQAVLQPVHDWALANRRQVMIGIFVMIGLLQVVKGLGII